MMRFKIAVSIALACLIGLGAWVGFWGWQKRHLLDTATNYYLKGDFRSASLSAQQALRDDPKNVHAHMIMAQIAKSLNSPEALVWQQKLATLQPGNALILIDMAATATGLGEWFAAERALEQVPPRDRETVAFHQATMTLAIATKQFGLADAHLQQALRIDPKNKLLELNLATVHLLSADPKVAADARVALKAMRSYPDPKIIQEANRALLNDARMRRDQAESLGYATQLVKTAECTLKDRLNYMEELQQTNPKDFDDTLGVMQTKALGSPEAVYALMTWMNSHGLAAKTIEWKTKMPARNSAEMPVPLACAEAYIILDQWNELRNSLLNADWGNLEFIRHAFQARVLEKDPTQGRGAEFRLKWDRAITSTKGDPNLMAILARLVEGWGWRTESAQVWWFIAQRKTGQHPALQALYRMYSEEKNTPELYRVARRIVEVEPANPVAKNNAAMLALLLGKDLPEAHRLALENSKDYPNDPALASTLALSLHAQNRSKEALETLQKLPEAALRRPSLAACYGAILAALGEREKAVPFLEIARQNRKELFPEEAAMADKALHPRQ